MKTLLEGRYPDARDSGYSGLAKFLRGRERIAPTLALVVVVLLATWMGSTSGGYFVGDWVPVAFILATLILVGSATGIFSVVNTRLGSAALYLFTGYAGWTYASMLWAPNRGDAWIGAGQTALYLLAFGATMALVASGASRRWVLIASVLGPASVAASTLWSLTSSTDTLFLRERLIGTVGYHNGEAAFLLVPFWVAVFLASSRRVHPILRGLVLAGATLCAELAILTQSRGALVGMAVALPVFFALSGQRLRGFLALTPIAVALLLAFPDLNGVYLEFRNEGDPGAVLDRIVPVIWATSAAAGLYAFFWGLVDRLWTPTAFAVRLFSAATVAVVVISIAAAAVLTMGTTTNTGISVPNPVSWAGQKWEAFKENDAAGQEQSRYLSASGTGRYALWQVAWKDFTSHPVLGVGTHNYEATYYRLREQGVGSRARQPHSLPLEVLGERGIVGGVLFFGFLTICLAAGLRQRFLHLDNDGKALVSALIAAVAYWFVHSCADWLWQLPSVTLPVVVYLAVLAAPWQQMGVERVRRLWRLTVFAATALVAASLASLYMADRQLVQSYATENPWVALATVDRAQRFNPFNPQLPQREAELAIQIGDWPRVVNAYEKATQLNSEHYAPYALLAQFYEQRGEPEKALPLYRKALTLNSLDNELNRAVVRLEG